MQYVALAINVNFMYGTPVPPLMFWIASYRIGGSIANGYPRPPGLTTRLRRWMCVQPDEEKAETESNKSPDGGKEELR